MYQVFSLVKKVFLPLILMSSYVIADASEFPVVGKPIRIYVGFPPGGGTDIQARQIAQQLTQVLGGVPVVVENRPGAGTMVAANEVTKAIADGHSLLYTPSSTLTQLPHTLLAVKYDTFKSFTPIAQGALGPLVLVTHKSIPVNNVSELVAYAKLNPGKLNYVSQGVGTSAHIFGQMFAQQTGIDIVHVPYKGANDVAKDFIAGRVHLQFASSSAAVALAKSGEVRLLATVAPRRSALFPELPTMGEQGIKGIDVESWIGFVGPPGMAPATVNRLSEAFAQILKSPGIQEAFRVGGVEAKWAGPDEFSVIIRNSYRQWGQSLSELGYKKE
jgi:tripartite-type tricarboxylate transporter receptor subunit TctC